MKKDDSFLDKIEDFSKIDLPDVEISDLEKEKIKMNARKVLDGLKERNKEMNFTITEEEVLKIKRNLISIGKENINGVKDAGVMKEIVEKTMVEELANKKIERSLRVNVRPMGYYYGSVAYYYLYLTADELIYYGFDFNYLLLNKETISIKDIQSAGLASSDGDDKEDIIPYYENIIELKDKSIAMIIHNREKQKELEKFLEAIRDKGVNDYDREKLAKTNKIGYIILWIMFALLGGNMIYNLILGNF
ncbi:hypothetical protein [Clostridium mediterraneense]|uniref:hypothetical protein n=1 Tax=Clostridium mediterraneense TaxID=1805472 RepID=UPI00082D443D|nr:hypothetical protein [Clostridium mediterraneense]